MNKNKVLLHQNKYYLRVSHKSHYKESVCVIENVKYWNCCKIQPFKFRYCNCNWKEIDVIRLIAKWCYIFSTFDDSVKWTHQYTKTFSENSFRIFFFFSLHCMQSMKVCISSLTLMWCTIQQIGRLVLYYWIIRHGMKCYVIRFQSYIEVCADQKFSWLAEWKGAYFHTKKPFQPVQRSFWNLCLL